MRTRLLFALSLSMISFSLYGCSPTEEKATGTLPATATAPSAAGSGVKNGAQATVAPEPAVNSGYNGGVGTKVK